MRSVTRLAAIAGAVISASASASAAGAVPKGTLTGAEYKRLSVGMTALDQSVSGKSVNWSRARAACRAVGGATGLLRTQRASCLESMAVLDALASFPPEERRCRAAVTTTTGTTTTGTTTDTTTTGTTTTPADSALIQVMVCMNPRYQALARYAKALDTGAIVARDAAVTRGFSGSCLAALAPTPTDLKKSKLFASSTARLAADVALLIRVTEGKAPSSDFNQAKIDNDVKQFETSATAVLDEHGQPKLSACPHQ
jgi:hypothetical protein